MCDVKHAPKLVFLMKVLCVFSWEFSIGIVIGVIPDLQCMLGIWIGIPRHCYCPEQLIQTVGC